MNNAEIVLFSPQIPQNTGNIGRLCVNTETRLHLIKPLGFSLDEKYIKRAGMDYWQYLKLEIHDNWKAFANNKDRNSLYFFSTKTEKVFWDCDFSNLIKQNKKIYLIFGSETFGLTEKLYNDFKDRLYKIPMYGNHCRSYNLSNSAAIVLFEYLRRTY
ncbi:MAG: tRNA (cytidine(34)-2'-O)-methyltransferase [Victivallales bacterium]|nr:tRNA (cytidine(34)-2'-O)-methyltransferase [Victivallales bacterium]